MLLGAIVLLLVISIGGGLLVLLAYGIGHVVNRVLEFTQFEATALSFAGMFVVIFILVSLFRSILPTAQFPMRDEYEDDDE